MCAVLVVALTLAPSTARGASAYGVQEQANVPIHLDDGTTVLANVYRPSGASPGTALPVILSITPYGATESTILADGEAIARAGYIYAAAEIRGTGSSGGTYQVLGPREQADGPEIVRWAATLPGANGSVGMYGPSYLSISQLYTAGLIGAHSPLKAIVPVVAGNDDYRDIVAPGGIPALTAVGGFLFASGLAPALVPATVATDPLQALSWLAGRVGSEVTVAAPLFEQIVTGGDGRYDNAFWQERNPDIPAIARSRIPTLVIGGWQDIFQQGEPLVYTELQNTFAGRPPLGPMRAGQRLSSRFQIIDGPWTHLAGGFIPQTEEVTWALRWFDTWLKGAKTGLRSQREPMHLFELGSGRWVNAADWPVEGSKVSTMYFGAGRANTVASINDGTLAASPPTTTQGEDALPYSQVPALCSWAATQYATGPQESAAALLGLQASQLETCLKDERLLAGQSLTYTTAPFSRDVDIAGPGSVNLYERSSTPESETIVTLQDVRPSGQATPIDTGYALGSMRALDPSLSWSVHGRLIMPVQADTSAAAAPMPVGAVVPVHVGMGPVLARIARGDRLRVAITTNISPALSPTVQETAQLVGQVTDVQRTRTAASSISVPMISPDSLETSSVSWGGCQGSC